MELTIQAMIKMKTTPLVLLHPHLTPKVHCSKVTSPEAKNVVLKTSLMTSVLFAKHIGPLRTKGMANVPPTMVR